MQELSVSGLAGLMTVAGGLLALRARAYRALIFAFCAGALIGTALLVLVPEAFELRASRGQPGDVHALLLTSLFGFFLFYLLENISDLDPRGEPGSVLHHTHGHTTGLWAALGISVHSFLDGVAIAQGFEAAARLGWTVALGVAMHKFADGVSVIGVMQGTHQGGRSTLTMLSVVALAPILGAAAQPFLDIPTRIQALLFGWFAGVFLYLGATSLLPAAHEAGHSRGLPLWALGGALLVYTAQLLVG